MTDQVNVMGCSYKIIRVNRGKYKTCEGADGWCDLYGKKIYYVDPETDPDSDPIAASPEELIKQVLRHEIVHAFLAESMKKWWIGLHGTVTNCTRHGRRQG